MTEALEDLIRTRFEGWSVEDIAGYFDERIVSEGLRQRPETPACILIGSTCAGKTQSTCMLARDPEMRSFDFVGEMFTDLVIKHGLPLSDRSDRDTRRVQYVTAYMQLKRECEWRPKNATYRYPVIERGVLDNAVFLPGGLEETLAFSKLSLQQVYDRYRLVVHLGLPPEDIYLAKRSENPARRPESYRTILDREYVLGDVYGGHPGYRFVEFTESWEAKVSAIRVYLLEVLQTVR